MKRITTFALALLLLLASCGGAADETENTADTTVGEVIEETGNIQISCTLLREYNKNDTINILFTDEEQPVPIAFKIISRTTSGHYICEFV